MQNRNQKILQIIFSYVDKKISKQEMEKLLEPLKINMAEKYAHDRRIKEAKWIKQGLKPSEEYEVESIEEYYIDNKKTR